MEKLTSANIQSWLGWFFRGILLLSFLVLLGRLIVLSGIKREYFKALAEGNRIRRIPISAPRGKVLARGGQVLAGNREVEKRVVFNPEKGYEKLTDTSGASDEEIITEWKREYPLGSSLAHAIGYLGEANEQEVGKVNPSCPDKGPIRIGTLVGRTGLEKEYECRLTRIGGEELVEVDSRGERIRTLGTREPVPGQDIKTTIHYNLQRKVAEVMQEKRGAAVVTSPSGEVLAFYSSPAFNPNSFVNNSSDEVEGLLNDEDLPFFNRAIGGSFHPGSVFKPVVAIGALEEGAIDEDFTYEDEGRIVIETQYGTFTYNNWYFTQYGGTEGEIDLTRAIARSTDTFFYKTGELMGPQSIAGWAHRFRLDKKTGIDLPGEVAGFIPTPEWKKRVKGEQWFLGDTFNISIGQGDVELTPIGINTAISAIANNGRLCLPRFVEDPECSKVSIDKENLELVQEGMIEACTEGGTGSTFFNFEPQVACKTGTAETFKENETHAWFTVYAPSDLPEIVATVLVEEGGEGSSVAGPIATEIFDYWFNQQRN